MCGLALPCITGVALTACCALTQDGTTALLDACSRGDTAIVKVLLAVEGVLPNLARAVRSPISVPYPQLWQCV